MPDAYSDCSKEVRALRIDALGFFSLNHKTRRARSFLRALAFQAASFKV